jgi:hypothetical protein
MRVSLPTSVLMAGSRCRFCPNIDYPLGNAIRPAYPETAAQGKD